MVAGGAETGLGCPAESAALWTQVQVSVPFIVQPADYPAVEALRTIHEQRVQFRRVVQPPGQPPPRGIIIQMVPLELYLEIPPSEPLRLSQQMGKAIEDKVRLVTDVAGENHAELYALGRRLHYRTPVLMPQPRAVMNVKMQMLRGLVVTAVGGETATAMLHCHLPA